MVYRDFIKFSFYATTLILVLSLLHLNKNIDYNLSVWFYLLIGIISNIIFLSYTRNKKFSSGSVLLICFFVGTFYLLINNFIF